MATHVRGRVDKIFDLWRELVWIACRHHVLKVVLTSAFRAALGPTSEPDRGLFKRFQDSWRQIEPGAHRARDDQTFAEIGQMEARSKSIKHLKAVLQHSQQTRVDYKKLLELCVVFLGGGDENTRFRTRSDPSCSVHGESVVLPQKRPLPGPVQVVPSRSEGSPICEPFRGPRARAYPRGTMDETLMDRKLPRFSDHPPRTNDS